MIHYYSVDEKGLQKSSTASGNFWFYNQPTNNEIAALCAEFELPEDLFDGLHHPEEVSRLEVMHTDRHGTVAAAVFLDLERVAETTIEKRLKPIIMFLTEEKLVMATFGNDHLPKKLLRQAQPIQTLEQVMATCILVMYTEYVKELRRLKKDIDHLDQAARKTTENEELYRLADLERSVVYLEKTLENQKETLQQLHELSGYTEKVADVRLIRLIRVKQQQAEKMAAIYRELIETIGGLFSDMMDNHLNHLMKYLDSATLIISVPTLIAGLWGMNTGGLPGHDSELGFLLMTVFSLLCGIAAAVHLKIKDYS